MKVLNIHKRILKQPMGEVSALIETLSTSNDKIWPSDKWPLMKFQRGIAVGAKGGHGPIRYTVEKYNPKELIQFRFTSPKGFNGIHKFEVKEVNSHQTEVKHVIDMNTSGMGTWKWIFGIRTLHNALLEDGLDKLENNFDGNSKSSNWNLWVRFLRKILG